VPQKKRKGRPKLPDRDIEVLYAKFTGNDAIFLRRVKEFCKQEGVNFSDFVRKTIMNRAEKLMKEKTH